MVVYPLQEPQSNILSGNGNQNIGSLLVFQLLSIVLPTKNLFLY